MSGSDATPSEPWELRLAYETGSSVRHMPSVQSQQSDNLQPQSSPSALSLRPVDQVLPRSMGPPPLPQASLAAATPSSASESEQPTDLDARGAIAAPSSSNGSGASAKRQKTATHNTKLDLDEQRKLCLACLALKDDFPHPRHGRENWWLRVSALFSEGRSKAYGVNACKNAMAFGIARRRAQLAQANLMTGSEPYVADHSDWAQAFNDWIAVVDEQAAEIAGKAMSEEDKRRNKEANDMRAFSYTRLASERRRRQPNNGEVVEESSSDNVYLSSASSPTQGTNGSARPRASPRHAAIRAYMAHEDDNAELDKHLVSYLKGDTPNQIAERQRAQEFREWQMRQAEQHRADTIRREQEAKDERASRQRFENRQLEILATVLQSIDQPPPQPQVQWSPFAWGQQHMAQPQTFRQSHATFQTSQTEPQEDSPATREPSREDRFHRS